MPVQPSQPDSVEKVTGKKPLETKPLSGEAMDHIHVFSAPGQGAVAAAQEALVKAEAARVKLLEVLARLAASIDGVDTDQGWRLNYDTKRWELWEEYQPKE